MGCPWYLAGYWVQVLHPAPSTQPGTQGQLLVIHQPYAFTVTIAITPVFLHAAE